MAKLVRYVSVVRKIRFDIPADELEQIVLQHIKPGSTDVEMEWDVSGDGIVRGLSVVITEREEKTE